MRGLELGDHAGDQRVHEERRAADPHHARLPLRKLSTSCEAFRDAASIACPWSASARPSGVGWSGRRPLRKSGSPSRFSSIERVRDTAGWVSPIRAAPR